jgi:hypothetical protein
MGRRLRVGLQSVMHRHLVTRAAFFGEADPAAFPVLGIVLPPHGDRRAHPRERITHPPDEGAITQADDG